ncbi:MAG: peroxiredoxin [Rhodobacteraceae bacterium]|nr:peroxiredoxin [Paracoccaceae bacterium]
MTVSVGDKLPAATFLQIGSAGPEPVELAPRLAGKKVVIFAVPAAFSGTCTNAHVPSFIRTKPLFEAKGVSEIICVAANDPFVMKAWGESTGATAAGLTLLSDADGSFAQALGLSFSNPATGLFNRSQRYSMLVEDGVVKVLRRELKGGTCEISGGEALLAEI